MSYSKDIITKKPLKKWSKSTSVKLHDLYNFESKIDYRYTLEKTEKKKTSYLLDTFFFIPRSLQINKETYHKSHFFSDLNYRIRFKTPQMSIQEILDQTNGLSPLNVIKKNLEQVSSGNTDSRIIKTIMRELRLLACIIKVSLREEFNFLIENFQIQKESIELAEILESDLNNIQIFKEEILQIGKKIIDLSMPIEVSDAFQYSNDYMSLQLEKWLTRLIVGLDKQLTPNIRDLIENAIINEQVYRKDLNSRLILKKDSNNEEFSYMEGITKKYVQGVLYLEKEKKDPQSSSLELFYSIAAGFAMFISLFLGFLILDKFEVNSIPFIIAVVIIYMLRDRIKDYFKGISQKAVSFLFPDQRIDIVDGFYEEKIGKSKHKVYFIEPEKIPLEVINIRQSSNKSPIEKEGKPEECIIFRKKIILLKKKIDKLHTRRKDISDVTRFNIQNFLRYTDDPTQRNLIWDSQTSQITSLNVSKLYHINIVIRFTTFQEKAGTNTYFKKYRIIIDQQGIKRIVEPELLF